MEENQWQGLRDDLYTHKIKVKWVVFEFGKWVSWNLEIPLVPTARYLDAKWKEMTA